MVICLERGANDLHMVQLMPLPTPSSLASLKTRLVLPFWCRVARAVLVKRMLDGCHSYHSLVIYCNMLASLCAVSC